VRREWAIARLDLSEAQLQSPDPLRAERLRCRQASTIANDSGEILNFQVTPANVDDRRVVPELTEEITGKIFFS
jgi:hypothetical protein